LDRRLRLGLQVGSRGRRRAALHLSRVGPDRPVHPAGAPREHRPRASYRCPAPAAPTAQAHRRSSATLAGKRLRHRSLRSSRGSTKDGPAGRQFRREAPLLTDRPEVQGPGGEPDPLKYKFRVLVNSDYWRSNPFRAK
jgi:hypothetical protein